MDMIGELDAAGSFAVIVDLALPPLLSESLVLVLSVSECDS